MSNCASTPCASPSLLRLIPRERQVLLEVPDEQKGGGKYERVKLLDKRPALSEVSPSVEAARFRVTPRSALGESPEGAPGGGCAGGGIGGTTAP